MGKMLRFDDKFVQTDRQMDGRSMVKQYTPRSFDRGGGWGGGRGAAAFGGHKMFTNARTLAHGYMVVFV